MFAAFQVKHDRRSLLSLVARTYRYYRTKLSEKLTESSLGLLPRSLLSGAIVGQPGAADEEEAGAGEEEEAGAGEGAEAGADDDGEDESGEKGERKIVIRHRTEKDKGGKKKKVPYYWVCQSKKCAGKTRLVRLTVMICKFCGKSRPCTAEGKSLPRVTTAGEMQKKGSTESSAPRPRPASDVCGKCSKPVEPTDRFCKSCGQPQTQGASHLEIIIA